MERKIKILYVGKSEYSLNLRVKPLRNTVSRKEGPTYDKYFQMPRNSFYDHAKFTIIEQVKNESLYESKIRNLLEHRADFWILKLQTLSS